MVEYRKGKVFFPPILLKGKTETPLLNFLKGEVWCGNIWQLQLKSPETHNRGVDLAEDMWTCQGHWTR